MNETHNQRLGLTPEERAAASAGWALLRDRIAKSLTGFKTVFSGLSSEAFAELNAAIRAIQGTPEERRRRNQHRQREAIRRQARRNNRKPAKSGGWK